MGSLSNYIKNLEDLKNNLTDIAIKETLKKQGLILGKVKLRFYNKGLDGRGFKIGEYSYETIQSKAKKNQKTTHITLRDTGDWYKSLFLDTSNGNIFINSNDEKHDELIDIYSVSITELTEEEQEFIIDTIVEPAIFKEVKKLNKNIDLLQF